MAVKTTLCLSLGRYVHRCALLSYNALTQAGDLFVLLFYTSYLVGSFLLFMHNLVTVRNK